MINQVPGYPAVQGTVRGILQGEGLAVFIGILIFYSSLKGSWLLFATVFFAPDLFMVGYLKTPKLGSVMYNFAHSYITSLSILGLGIVIGQPVMELISLIIIGHIGFDRAMGFGLKYPTAFGHTHLMTKEKP